MIQSGDGVRHVFLRIPESGGGSALEGVGAHSNVISPAVLQRLCLCMSDGVVSLSFCAYIRVCHNQYVRAVYFCPAKKLPRGGIVILPCDMSLL